jgi:hypothetical protein
MSLTKSFCTSILFIYKVIGSVVPSLILLINLSLSGALVVTLRQGQFKLKEDGFLESVLTGSDPDPYVIVSVLENEIREPKKDTIRSRIMKVFGDKEPKTKAKKQSSFMRVLDSAKSDRKVCKYVDS